MKNQGIFLLIIGTLASCVLVGFVVSQMSSGYFQSLRQWRETARTQPEGPITEALFSQGVDGRAIEWNPDYHIFEMRKDRNLPDHVHQDLFRTGERGLTIKAELERLHALGSYVALRTRSIDCVGICKDHPEWSVSTVDTNVASIASGVSRSRTSNVSAPLPKLHYALSRDTSSGYSDWAAWHALIDLKYQIDAKNVSSVDIVGDLETVPEGWAVTKRWCRDERARLTLDCNPPDCTTVTKATPCSSETKTLCGTQNRVAAVRITRSSERQNSADADILDLRVNPLPILVNDVHAGDLALSDRITLSCSSKASCVAKWQPTKTDRRFSRPGLDVVEKKRTKAPRGAKVLGDWVQVQDGDLQPTQTAFGLGMGGVLGVSSNHRNSLISAVSDLPENSQARFTIDEDIQTAASELLNELLFAENRGRFSGLGLKFPTNYENISLVVMDLRDEHRGAIRAAVGTPELKPGASAWDLSARPHDGGSPVAPGAAAWTGSGWWHIPGSTFKILTSLALIDAASDTTTPRETARALEEAIKGVTSSRADTVLGQGLLDSPYGLCVPITLSDGVGRATAGSDPDAPKCGAGYDGAAIRDSGKGGPFHGLDRTEKSSKYGISHALVRSSNIWFVAAMMRAEQDDTGKSESEILRTTAKRLGLMDPLPLDGGLGLDLLPRQAINIEAFGDCPVGNRALASAAFGQRVQAGPLVQAQLAAAVALGKIVEPTLLQNAVKPSEPLFTSALANELLENVREGMRGVVNGKIKAPNGRTGTAVAAFEKFAPNLKKQNRVGGKTGTAQRGSGRDRTSTFAGWLDDADEKPAFAFGCGATARASLDKRTPQVCAQLVAALMQRIDTDVLSK